MKCAMEIIAQYQAEVEEKLRRERAEEEARKAREKAEREKEINKAIANTITYCDGTLEKELVEAFRHNKHSIQIVFAHFENPLVLGWISVPSQYANGRWDWTRWDYKFGAVHIPTLLKYLSEHCFNTGWHEEEKCCDSRGRTKSLLVLNISFPEMPDCLK